MAIRHCIELGYHRSAERYHRNTDALTKEMSKRCFWVAYDIDRVVAFTLGRPVGIPDDSIDAEVGYRCYRSLIIADPPRSYPWTSMTKTSLLLV